jgi:hypothetical protein
MDFNLLDIFPYFYSFFLNLNLKKKKFVNEFLVVFWFVWKLEACLYNERSLSEL